MTTLTFRSSESPGGSLTVTDHTHLPCAHAVNTALCGRDGRSARPDYERGAPAVFFSQRNLGQPIRLRAAYGNREFWRGGASTREEAAPRLNPLRARAFRRFACVVAGLA